MRRTSWCLVWLYAGLWGGLLWTGFPTSGRVNYCNEYIILGYFIGVFFAITYHCARGEKLLLPTHCRATLFYLYSVEYMLLSLRLLENAFTREKNLLLALGRCSAPE